MHCFCLVGPPLRRYHLFFHVFKVSLWYSCLPGHLYSMNLPSFHSIVLLCPLFFVLVQQLLWWSFSACNLSTESIPHSIACLTRLFTVSLHSSVYFHLLSWIPPIILPSTCQDLFLSLCFCLHDYPRPACLFPFSGWQPLIHPLIPNSYIATSLWIKFLFSCSSHSTLFSALIGMYFTLYHHYLFLSFRPIKLYVSWRQEPT